MVYLGHIRNGQVVLDEPADLPEGSAVSIHRLESASVRSPGSPAAIATALTTWDGSVEELDHLLSEVQSLRDGDLPLRLV